MPDYRLQIVIGTKTLTSGDLACGLMKLKQSLLATMTIVTFGKTATLCSSGVSRVEFKISQTFVKVA